MTQYRVKKTILSRRKIYENIFREHMQDGSNWIFSNEKEYKELLALLKYFKGKILFDEEYNPNLNSITIWCDGIARGIYNQDCLGNYPITYDYYHPFYEELKIDGFVR